MALRRWHLRTPKRWLARRFLQRLAKVPALDPKVAPTGFDWRVAVAVDEAVREAMTADGFPGPHAEEAVMSSTYRYDRARMVALCGKVAAILRDKGMTFAFDTPFAVAQLSKRLIDFKTNVAFSTHGD